MAQQYPPSQYKVPPTHQKQVDQTLGRLSFPSADSPEKQSLLFIEQALKDTKQLGQYLIPEITYGCHQIKKYLERYWARDEQSVLKKSDNSLVTEADKYIEQALRESLTQLLPGSVFLGEETAPKTIDEVKKLFESSYIWVVDPIDGTSNFSQRNGHHSVSIGLMIKTPRGHLPIIGFLYLPEKKILYCNAGKRSLTISEQRKVLDTPKTQREHSLPSLAVSNFFLREYDPARFPLDTKLKMYDATSLHMLETALGQTSATYTKAYLWDICAGLAIGHSQQRFIYPLDHEVPKLTFTEADFTSPATNTVSWRIPDPVIFTTPAQHLYWKEVIKGSKR